MGIGKSSALTKFDTRLRKQKGGKFVGDVSDPAGFFTAPETIAPPKRAAPQRTSFSGQASTAREASRRASARKKGRRANILSLENSATSQNLGGGSTFLG